MEEGRIQSNRRKGFGIDQRERVLEGSNTKSHPRKYVGKVYFKQEFIIQLFIWLIVLIL